MEKEYITLIEPEKQRVYSRTDKRYILELEGIKLVKIERVFTRSNNNISTNQKDGRFLVVSSYGKHPSRFRVWCRSLLFNSACDEAKYVLSWEKTVKEVFLIREGETR